MFEIILFILGTIVAIIGLCILILIIKVLYYMFSFVFLTVTKAIGWIIVWGIAIWVLISLI